MSVLTILECGSIQNYIFASNRLREAIGASYLVKEALEGNLYEALSVITGSGSAGRESGFSRSGWENQTGLTELIETGFKAEILYIGGGKAAVLFLNKEIARETLSYLSSRLLVRAPGLILYSGQSNIDSTPGGLGRAWQTSLADLSLHKERGQVSLRSEGLGLTTNCVTTGLAATIRYEYREDNWTKVDNLSASAAARRAASVNANSEAKAWLNEMGGRQYDPPENLENLGGLEGEDHLAVVHIDGNSIGVRLDTLVRTYQDRTNDELARALRQFSHSLKLASSESLNEVTRTLIQALSESGENTLAARLQLEKNGRKYLPLRLLISGGDDLTFVCEGRLGLALAALYLQTFSRKTDSLGQPFSACAGVVIARNHFPLARAYQLSEELCRRAKQKARKENYETNSSWLDFQILFSGLNGSLTNLREFEGLYWRPYRVTGNLDDAASWTYFEKQLLHFKENWPRSQVKGLADALSIDAASKSNVKLATRQFLSQAKLRENQLYNLPTVLLSDGWSNQATPLFDPIEAADFYLEVKG